MSIWRTRLQEIALDVHFMAAGLGRLVCLVGQNRLASEILSRQRRVNFVAWVRVHVGNLRALRYHSRNAKHRASGEASG